MTKALKVTSIGEFGEHTMNHPIYEAAPESMIVVAILEGVIRAGHVIKAFEVVEV